MQGTLLQWCILSRIHFWFYATTNPSLIQKLKEKYKVLLVDKKRHYRNRIKTEDGYIIILYQDKKNVEVSTDILLAMD